MKAILLLLALLLSSGCAQNTSTGTPIAGNPVIPPAKCDVEPEPVTDPIGIAEDCIELQDPDADAQVEDLLSPMATPVIDMFVAYTPAARAKYGTTGIKNLINKGISDTNRAFIDSGIAAQVRLVGTLETKHNETGNFQSDLYALVSKTDSKFNEVHNARARAGADQVTLIGAYSSNNATNGIGYVRASASRAMTIVKASSFGAYTFSHELGHNFGLNHSDGLENAAGKFRTIIAYGSYARIRRYSNPSRPYNGYKTGDSSHNEARIMNANANRMSNLMPRTVPMTEPTPEASATPCP